MEILAVTLFVLPKFLGCVEKRPGVVLPDPIHQLIRPVDLTWLIFSLIYAGLIVTIAWLLQHPRRLILALQGYSVLVWFRIGAMYLVALEPPAATIPLEDPFVQIFGPGQVLMKDLFFSGHTSTLFLLYLTVTAPVLRRIFLVAVVAVAIAVRLTSPGPAVYSQIRTGLRGRPFRVYKFRSMFMISIGWLVPTFLRFVSIYAAIAAWILWPNIVAVWGSDKRRALQAAILRRGDLNGKKKGRQKKNTDRKISSFRALYV